ncbi:MAG: hypothetical protein JZU55_17100 [Afipia sp.]|nr:hypothetical protein [Afipia sp.]
MMRQTRVTIIFIGIGLLIYAGFYLAAERLMYRNGHSNPFFKIATTKEKAFDWVILGASHYVADSFAFYSRTWNEDRFGDAKMLRTTPLAPYTAWLLLQYSRQEDVDPRAVADYVTGFSKINNRDRFQKDVWEGELQFDRAYRPSSAAIKSRIKYLFPDSGRSAELPRYLTEFDQMLKLAEQHNIRVVVIKMPTPAQFRAALLNEAAFDGAITAATANDRAGFRDLSAELDEPRFYFDTDHLNRTGVTEFFDRHLKAILMAPPN